MHARFQGVLLKMRTCTALVACSGDLSSRTRTSRGKRMEMPCEEDGCSTH